MFFKKDLRTVYRHQFERELKENGIAIDAKLMDYFFKDFSKFNIKYRFVKIPKKTMVQRLNHFWVYPLFILSIPFTYVLLGDFYINRDSKLGSIMAYLLGEY